MDRKIIVTAEADEEISEAYFWYESKELGLGDWFLRALKRSIQTAAAQPELYPVRFEGVRRIIVTKFPYTIYFEHDADSLSVLSVFQQSRDPSQLNRLRKP